MSSHDSSPAAASTDTPSAEEEAPETCTRQKPYATHSVRALLGVPCGRTATDKDKDGKVICAVHRGADIRGEQNRQRAKARYYFRLGINPETGKSIMIPD